MSAPANLAIAHRRVEPADSLDYFPTPPWATRALFHHVLGRRGFGPLLVEEPACGEGHMAWVLMEYFGRVRASDIHPYGFGTVRDFLEADAFADQPAPDWIITNPPFGGMTLRFMLCALERATVGVAFLLRTTQLEGVNRYLRVYRRHRPAIVAQFVERVPIHKGRWVPDGATMTSYAWFVWRLDRPTVRTELEWIPPCRDALTQPLDVVRFGRAA